MLDPIQHPLFPLSSSCLTRGSIKRECRIAESGRSMVEIIGMLAVAGVLSIGGIMGYKYAIDKSKANRIMKDVELAYVATSSANQKDGGLTEYTDALSGYPTFTERLIDEDFQTDIVLVKNVPESVCDKILEMTESSDWVVSAVESDTNYLYPLSDCENNNAMVFSTEDVRDFAYACEKECPENMMCGVNDDCICASGFEMNEAGECIAKTCNLTLGPEAQPDRYCCEQLGGYWNYDTQPQMCGCDEGYFFNGKECAVDNWCSYTYTVPEVVHGIQADCAYEIKVPQITHGIQADCAYEYTATNTNGIIQTTMTPVAGKTCSNSYCILNWMTENCHNGVGINTSAAGQTKTIYGRCAPFNEYHTTCQTTPENEVSMTPVAGKTCSNSYCILNWMTENCHNGVGINTSVAGQTKTIYGRCAPFDEYHTTCQTTPENEVSMTLNRPCQLENTYCSILWKNRTCTNISFFNTNTQTDLYGVCLSYDGTGDQTCPIKK